jgi:hypothetical protein
LKDFFQYASPTRVIAGRALLESTGFEFKKEGARRVFVVTDPVVRGTGLVERLEAGVADGHFQAAAARGSRASACRRGCRRWVCRRTGSPRWWRARWGTAQRS